MFIVSFVSGLAGLILGWDQLYRDYLSKSVEIPVWLLLLAILVLPSVRIAYRSLISEQKPKELQKVEGKRFGVQQIIVDGKRFERCEFHGSEIIFEGSDSFSLVKCEFYSHHFTFSKYAATTLGVFTALYRDTAFHPLIEQTITNIQSGQHPQSIRPLED